LGNNTGGGINIAIELPGATNVGNCASRLSGQQHTSVTEVLW
jgi:hypothetical protein